MSIECLSGDSILIKKVIAQIPDTHPYRKMLKTIEGQFGNVEITQDQREQILSLDNKGKIYNSITFRLGDPSTHHSRELLGKRSHIYDGKKERS